MALSITADWEHVDSGPPEERATFAAIGIFLDDVALTKAEDAFVNRLRSSVNLSGYRLAEWFAWNWWRLRWESRTSAPEWALAHHISTVGGGYVWPNITIIPDGERVVLVCKPTSPSASEPLRYICDFVGAVRGIEFEGAVSRFIEQVIGQLDAERVSDTNLNRIWTEVLQERGDAEAARKRRFEALLGFDPDEAPPDLLERLLVEADELGESAVRELAATSFGIGRVPTAADLREIAAEKGFEVWTEEIVRLHERYRLSPSGQVPAWRRGAEAARALREQENLGASPVSNARLAQMMGVQVNILTERISNEDLSFVLSAKKNSARAVLRSKWQPGRRFELARLLGDRLAANASGPLSPATRTYTYRQKMQRSFAAEFLAPFNAVDEIMAGNYDPEMQEEVAEHFSVSPLTIRTLLANHGRIERDRVDEFELAAAV